VIVTVFSGPRLAVPAFNARDMILVATSGWASHHSAYWASLLNFGILIALVEVTFTL
jgi:hypothetical protein